MYVAPEAQLPGPQFVSPSLQHAALVCIRTAPEGGGGNGSGGNGGRGDGGGGSEGGSCKTATVTWP